MSNTFSQNYAPGFVGGVIGRSLIDSLRRRFTSSSLVQRGDYFMDQSRRLLQHHLQLIELHDQGIIHRNYERSRKANQGLVSHDGSKFQKFLKARKYKRVSKETYTIVKDASDRAINNRLMNQIAEATRPPGPPPESGSGIDPETCTVRSNLFSDSHAISMLSEVNVNDLNRVEMSTYQEEATDGRL